MICDRASLEKRSLLVFHNTPNIGVEFIADVVRKHGLSVLRGEDQVGEDFGRGIAAYGRAPSGLENVVDSFPQGVALGFHRVPLWGGSMVIDSVAFSATAASSFSVSGV